MTFDLTPVHLANLASALLLVAVALLVLKVAPRDRGNLAFALFAGGFGWRIACYYLTVGSTPDEPLKPFLLLAGAAGGVLASASMLLLAAWFPTPVARGERRLLAMPLAVYAVVGGCFAAGTFLADARFVELYQVIFRVRPEQTVLGIVESLAFSGVYAGIAMLLLLLALRAARAPVEDRGRYMLVGAALLTWWGTILGAFALDYPEPYARLGAFAAFGASGLAAAVWLRTANASGGPERRAARDMAWYCLGVPLAGLLLALSVGGFPASFSAWYFGATRVLMVLLLAYAVVRHQLLGIDLKVRWTIKQSTVAAAFIGLFFVASEGAQVVFSESAGPFVGIAAAGALVFAMAPLQRVAERLANAAVPGAGPAGAGDAGPDLYRRLAAAAWADGKLAIKERRMLEEARDTLRLDPREAARIEEEVARDAAPARQRT